jgi:hypothetical protein
VGYSDPYGLCRQPPCDWVQDAANWAARNGHGVLLNAIATVAAAGAVIETVGKAIGLGAECNAQGVCYGTFPAVGLSPAAELRGAPGFVVTSGGTAIPVPEGATGPRPTRAPGFQFTEGTGGGRGLDARVTGVRVMDANATQGRRAVFMNQGGQAVNPSTGRPAAKNDPNYHHRVDP